MWLGEILLLSVIESWVNGLEYSFPCLSMSDRKKSVIDFFDRWLIDHPHSGIVYNLEGICLSVCMYVCLSDDNFQEP